MDRFLAANVPIYIFGSTGKTMQHQQIINPDNDSKIIDSWFKNAAPWIVAIEERQIESRNLVTDRFEFDTKLRERAGLGAKSDIRRATYWRLTNEIQLLQAQQLLQQKQQADNSKAK